MITLTIAAIAKPPLLQQRVQSATSAECGLLAAGGMLCSSSAGRRGALAALLNLHGRGFLELLSKGGRRLRKLLSDPDPVPDWDITRLFRVPAL